jgi:probable F420-dependent oxidoreductase
VDFGVAIFSTDETILPDEVARMAEERGFESIFFPEHTHIPTSRRTPYPAGEPLPREYFRIIDPLVALTAAAGATSTIKLGTGILLVAQRDPIVTAKAVASVDLISNGRVLLGIGTGWNEDEMESHGVEPRRRFGKVKEHVEAMKAIWTDEEAVYDGKHVSFTPMNSWPKPVQPGGPPILVAGNGRTVYDRVLDYGDAWFPNRLGDEEKFAARIDKLQRLGKERGRDSVPVTLQLAPLDAAEIERYEQRGVTRCVWYLPPATRDKVEPALDRYAAAMEAAKA